MNVKAKITTYATYAALVISIANTVILLVKW
jgi:hypothetical protein